MMRSSLAVGAVVMGVLLAQLAPQRQPHAGAALFAGVALFGAAIAGGVGTLAVVALWAWRFPELRRVRRLAELRPG